MIVVSSAVRRGGNHAAANWLLPHMRTTTGYVHNGNINNLIKKDDDKGKRNLRTLIGASLFIPYEGIMVPVRANTQAVKNNKPVNNAINNNGSPLLPGAVDDLMDHEISVLYGVENHKPEFIDSNMVKHTSNKFDIFVQTIRSPWNNLASLMKYGGNLVKIEDFADLWIHFAKEHIGETNYTEPHFDRRVFINYDLWFTDKDYRVSISEDLGLEHTDYGLEFVSGQGGGSSFDKMSKNKKAQEMDVLDRWQAVANDNQFREVINNPELMDLAVEIFGPPPF